MMIAIISDIHGNYEALKEVFKQIDKEGIKEVYCLGDVVGYYSQVNECCEELRNRGVRCVMGNHDWYMVSETNCARSKSVRDCMAYQRKIITEDNKRWLGTFRTIIIVNGISMVHGGWINPIDEYIEPSYGYFEGVDGTRFVSGHTHIQKICYLGEKTYCNPGAVGQPRDGDVRAAFAVYDGYEFQLRRVEYDIEKTCALMDKAGFNPYYYGCLKDASRHLHV